MSRTEHYFEWHRTSTATKKKICYYRLPKSLNRLLAIKKITCCYKLHRSLNRKGDKEDQVLQTWNRSGGIDR